MTKPTIERTPGRSICWTERDGFGAYRMTVTADGSVYIETQHRPGARFEVLCRLGAEDVSRALGLAAELGHVYPVAEIPAPRKRGGR
jgi:hypothetical protein